MTSDQSTGNARTPQIALVGTTRAGKSVFTTVLAKYLEKKREGVWLSPKGGRPKSTYIQIEEWWSALRAGNWLPATTPGTLIELQWDLCVHEKKIPLQMFDYAGETLTDLFSGKKDNATGAAKEYFDKVRAVFERASVLLVLINLESFIEKDLISTIENKGTLVTSMSAFLENLKRDGRSCRVCFVFTAYDQYESVIKSRWGSVKNFLEREIPPLHNEFVDKKSNVEVLAVAAVGETEARVDPHDGTTIRYPKSGFKTAGFTQLIKWLIEAIGDSKVELDANAAGAARDEQNTNFVGWLENQWNSVSSTDQLPPLDRFLGLARKPLPYPHRPNATELQAKLLVYVNAANDLRATIVKRNVTASRQFSARIFKILVAIVLIAIVLIFAKSAFDKVVERQKLATKQAEAELLKEPRPEVISKNCDYTCIRGFTDCWEHRATATVKVKNEGGAGNVTTRFTIGSHSNSTTKYMNRGEVSTFDVTITKMSSHTITEVTYRVEASK